MSQQTNNQPTIKPLIVELLRVPAASAEWVDRCAECLRSQDLVDSDDAARTTASTLAGDPAYSVLAPEAAVDRYRASEA